MRFDILARKESTRLRVQFAAHLFVFTTKNGMIVSHLTHISPFKLHQWSETDLWKDTLKWWGYEGDSNFTGAEFHRQVGLGLTKRSLQKASQLWKALFGITENKELHKFFGREALSIEQSVNSSARQVSPPNYEVD